MAHISRHFGARRRREPETYSVTSIFRHGSRVRTIVRPGMTQFSPYGSMPSVPGNLYSR